MFKLWIIFRRVSSKGQISKLVLSSYEVFHKKTLKFPRITFPCFIVNETKTYDLEGNNNFKKIVTDIKCDRVSRKLQ